ncbi:Hypothetical predicted protein [Mytilus galloprovincialis]|uniref:Uncharacterized protein n=1 Tax=Mytilus galloprovincialis TaxID=29158 RepID=A0A8B6FA98_MYTGA|nr:Hypothetical predicted protein [Mytilus galloprovincialis]
MDGGSSHAGWIFVDELDGWWITCKLDFRRWMVDHMQAICTRIIANLEDTDLKEERTKRLSDATTLIYNWKSHIVRTVNQDRFRINMLESLETHQAMLVMDLTMKFLPLKYREKQTDWFGQRGVAGCQVSTVQIDLSKQKLVSHKIKKINSYNDVQVSEQGLVLRKAYGIGTGNLISFNEMAELSNNKLIEHRSGCIVHEAFKVPSTPAGNIKTVAKNEGNETVTCPENDTESLHQNGTNDALFFCPEKTHVLTDFPEQSLRWIAILAVVGGCGLSDPRALPAGASSPVGLPMLDRSKGRDQTKCAPNIADPDV